MKRTLTEKQKESVLNKILMRIDYIKQTLI